MRIAPVFVVTHAVVVLVAALDGANPSKETAMTITRKLEVLPLTFKSPK